MFSRFEFLKKLIAKKKRIICGSNEKVDGWYDWHTKIKTGNKDFISKMKNLYY